MSITSDLEQILSARYGKDVRQSIHDAIEEGYNIAVQAQGTAETSQESAEAYAAAALASEQAAQGYMELAEQYKNEAFSGTPTGYADLVAKVNSIYKETADSFSLADTVEGLALAHTIYGMSEQDGTPTPSVPVDIDSAVANFKCVGKNLLDLTSPVNNIPPGITVELTDDGGIHISGTRTDSSSGTWGVQYVPLTILKYGESYTFTCNDYSTISMTIYYVGSITTDKTFTWTQDSSKTLKVDLLLQRDVNYDVTLYPMLRFSSVTNSTFEACKSKSITTGLTLRAIEVTSSDDYNLVKDGKYYIADTLDWNEDNGYSITRRIANITFDGENYTSAYYTTVTVDNVTLKQVNLSSATNDVIKAAGPYVACNILKTISTNSERAASTIRVANTDGIIAAYFDNSMTFTSTSTFDTWASENPFVLQYVLATPTSETVTSAQAQALLGLKTYDGATSIDATGDVAPNVTLEYSKDRSTALALIGHNMAHINALKIADLSA